MNSSKLFTALALLRPAEWKRFELFLQSPYFSPPERNLHLLRLLAPYSPDFQDKKLTKKFIFEQLHPRQTFNDQRLRDDFSALYRSLKQFLAQEARATFPGLDDWMLLRSLQDHQAISLFETEERAISAERAALPLHDEKWHYLAFRIADEKNQLFGLKQVREADQSLTEKVQALDTYYLYVRLRESCEILNRASLLHTEEAHIPAELSALALRYDHIPPIRFYRQALAMLAQPHDIQLFEQLQNSLFTQSHAISREEASALFRLAQNHCIRRMNAGQPEAAKALLAFYRFQLEAKLLPLNDILEHIDYRNIVITAIRNHEYEWAKTFALTWKEKITPQYQEVAFNYVSASISFETGQYREAIRLLQTVDSVDVFYYINARDLLIRLFYEIGDYETMGYQLASFKTYLRRNKSLSEAQKKPRMAFIDLATALMRAADATGAESERRKQQLLATLAAGPQALQLAWLRQKAEAL